MPSSVIRSFAWFPEGELLVTFRTGRRYLYSGVPHDAARKLRSSFAKGPHFNRHIRGRFPYRELGPDEAGPRGAPDAGLSWGGS